jgi:hypothetical protein
MDLQQQLQAAIDVASSLRDSIALVYAAAVGVGYVTMEQIMFHFKRSFTLPGPKVVAPIIGEFVRSIDCFLFVSYLCTSMRLALRYHTPLQVALWRWSWIRMPFGSASACSAQWNGIAGYFMVYSANAAVTPEILKSNGPDSFQLVLHPNGVKVFGGPDVSLKLGFVFANLSFPSSHARPWTCT